MCLYCLCRPLYRCLNANGEVQKVTAFEGEYGRYAAAVCVCVWGGGEGGCLCADCRLFTFVTRTLIRSATLWFRRLHLECSIECYTPLHGITVWMVVEVPQKFQNIPYSGVCKLWHPYKATVVHELLDVSVFVILEES